MPRHYSESSADMAVHGRNVYDLIEKFKIINSKKEKVLYVCSTIQGFRGHGNHVNSAHADEFLNAVLPFMESNLDFANVHDEWISALVGIIGDHAASSSIDCIEEYSYRYHDSYEKAVFVVLTMVETSQVLKNFMSSLMRLGLTDILVEAFGAILVRDISYATQEIALDILCRMAMLCSQPPQTSDGKRFMKKLLAVMPEPLQIALNDPNIGPQGMLVNMRPGLNEINKTNDNVKSFHITAFGIEVARSVPYKRKISGSTWLDMSKEILTLYIPEKDMMVKFSYHLITRVHFATSSNTMQIGLERAPDSVEGLIQANERAPKGKPTFFFVEFGEDNKQAIEGVRAAFTQRLQNAETLVLTDNLEKRRKYSIISSRDQTPEDLKVALSRFHQSQYPVVVLDTVRSEIISDTEVEGPTDLVSIKDQIVEDKTKQTVVVTASKVVKPLSRKNETNEMHYASRNEDNLTAISSPEMDDDEMDRGYSRHKAVEKKVVQKVPQSIPLSDQAKNAAASVTNATQKSAPSTVKEAAKDPGRARIMKGKTIAETLLPKKDMPPSTKTAFMGNSTPLSKMSKKKDKGKNSPPSIPIVVQVLADDIIPVPIRRKSTIATALQDVSNTFTPMTRTPQPVNLKRTYASRSNGKKAAENHDALVSTTVAPEINDENTDPLEQNSQPTTANNSRRRSYKSGPSIAARIPSGKITILPLSGTKKGDSLIGMSAAPQPPRIRDLTVTPSARETINEEMEGEVEANKENEFQKLLKIRSVSTTKTARMRTNTCSEEENEVPKDSANVRVDIPRGTQILTSSKDNLNERRGRSKRRARDSAAYRLREDATLADEAQNDYNDADDEISSSPEKDIVDDENKDKTLLKRSRKSSDGDLAASSVPPTEATSQSTSTPLLSWRPSAGLTTFSSPDQSSNTDDSAEKVVQSAAISATSGLGSKGIEKDKTTIKPPVLPLMVPQPPCQEKIQSPSQDGNDSTYSRSEASDHYAQKRSKGAAERDSRIKYSSSDEDGPSSDEDGVIAMLLEELVTMQKSRATRKRARLMTSAVDTASVQVNSYLKQWSDFTDASTSDLHATMNLKLEALCATADKVCEALAAESTKYDVEGKEAKTIAQSIEAEIATLQMEISSATDAQRDEEAAMKAVLTTKRRTAIETARKSIVHVKKDRGVQSNRQNTKQLMLALRDL